MTTLKRQEIEEHIQFLLNNPTKTLGSIYHDAGSCWELIEVLLEKLRESREQHRDLKFLDN